MALAVLLACPAQPDPDPDELGEEIRRSASGADVARATDLYVRWSALVRRHDPELLEAILDGSREHPDVETRTCGFLASGRPLDRRAWGDVGTLASGADWWLRMEAARLVRLHGAAEQKELLARLASDPDWRVRILATGDAAVLDEADHARWTARMAPERVLEERRALEVYLGVDDTIATLRRSLRARAWWARWLAAHAAGERGREDLVPSLHRLLHARDWWVRRAAAEALAAIAAPASRGPLEGALADADEGVRLWAASGLMRLH